MVSVWIHYSMNLTSWGEYDSVLEALAESSGGTREGSGTDFNRNERDLRFLFPTETDARTFAARVNGWPTRYFRVEVGV
jgi:hypothetical protein